MATIEQAVDFGRFIDYNNSWEFVRDLEDAKSSLDALVSQDEAQRAVSLYETFLAACYAKADEIDDSSGSLGDFYGELFCSWIKARQVAGLPEQETVDQILRCMKNDDYGFCFGIEKDVSLVLNKEGFRLFKKHFEDGFERAGHDRPLQKQTIQKMTALLFLRVNIIYLCVFESSIFSN